MSEFEDRLRYAYSKLITVGVTGTNGKTTTTTMLDSIVRASGQPHASLTTLEAQVCGNVITAENPNLRFLRLVETAVRSKVRTLALEITSKALIGGFGQRWPSAVAIFTNLSRDHLDMHQSPEEYLASKAQLFMSLRPGGIAVLNADDHSARLIADVIPEGRKIRIFSAKGNEATLSAEKISVSPEGTHVLLKPSQLADKLGGEIRLSAVGDVHGANAMGAALAAEALGYEADAILTGLREFQTVAGRFEIVSHSPMVVVDYAHTPDGLRGTLRTAGPLLGPGGKIICVFGCGGNRDKGKRAIMGHVAHTGADRVILTSDNPRFEEPDRINQDVLAGMKGKGASWTVENDRSKAIGLAIHGASSSDVVIIAGKGHETEQEIGGEKIPFSDAEVARRYLD